MSAFEEAFTNQSRKDDQSSDDKGEDDKNIERIWYKSMVVPNIQRCEKLIQAYSFIENQIKVQLTEYMVSTRGYTIIQESSSPARSISLDEALRKLQESWRAAFVNYVRAESPSNNEQAKELKKQISKLGEYRNAVVHSGGRMKKKGFEDSVELPGIFNFAGTVYVTPAGEATLLKLAHSVTDFLCEL